MNSAGATILRPGEHLGFNKLAVFDSVGYNPHPGQLAVHKSNARMKVVPCGRRFGKSVIGGNELVIEALYTRLIYNQIRKGTRREFWIVGPEYSDAEKEFRIVWNTLTDLGVQFDSPGSYYNVISGRMQISLWGGRFLLQAKSAKYPATLVGEGLSGLVLAEAAKIKQAVWVQYLRPTLADFRGWALMTSTPEGKNWYYDLYNRGQDPDDPAWESWRMPSWSNPYIFPGGATQEAIDLLHEKMSPSVGDKGLEITWADIIDAGMDSEIVDMSQDMSAAKFSQEIEADFTDFVGRVFKDWDKEIHVGSFEYDPRYPVYAAVDYGWTHPFVWLIIQVDPFDNLRVLYEYRVTNRDIGEIANDLRSHPLTALVRKFYPDPADPAHSSVLERVLGIPFDSDTGGELTIRLEMIRNSLKISPDHGPERFRKPQLMVDRRCTGLIREMEEYRYPETQDESKRSPSEIPMDKDDHGPEALGRFFKGHYGGLLPKEKLQTTQSRAEFRRHRQ